MGCGTRPGASRCGLTLLLTATPVQWLLIQLGRMPEPTPAQVQVFSFLSWGLLSLDALLGILVLRGRWREAMTLDTPTPDSEQPLDTGPLPDPTHQLSLLPPSSNPGPRSGNGLEARAFRPLDAKLPSVR